VADLLRIASAGTGILPEGALHPDLANRLAGEAAKAAQHVLNVCIRALDYCPPVDIDFGDYLRAIVTADVDLVPDDDRGYRVAFIEAFRRRGIHPRDVRALSVDSLRWPGVGRSQGFVEPLAARLRDFADEFRYLADRRRIFDRTEHIGAELHKRILAVNDRERQAFGDAAGLAFAPGLPGLRPGSGGVPSFQVHSLRPARRVGPDGDMLNQLILSIIQTRDVPLDPARGRAGGTMKFRGGSTLILDLDTLRLRYAVRKDIADDERLARERAHRRGVLEEGSPRATYFADVQGVAEPFALLHRSADYGRL
jgi:hypothetical protein